MQLGQGLGLNKDNEYSAATAIVNSFEQRVLADGGDFYARQCLIKFVNDFSI